MLTRHEPISPGVTYHGHRWKKQVVLTHQALRAELEEVTQKWPKSCKAAVLKWSMQRAGRDQFGASQAPDLRLSQRANLSPYTLSANPNPVRLRVQNPQVASSHLKLSMVKACCHDAHMSGIFSGMPHFKVRLVNPTCMSLIIMVGDPTEADILGHRRGLIGRWGLTASGGKEEGRDSRAGAEPPDFNSSAQAPSCNSPRAALYRRSSNCSRPSGPARSPCSSSLHQASWPSEPLSCDTISAID